ncbi:LLM class flavin-dependent oxidoreductase [Mycolicibacter kumamotonensis]|jgi:alkanesulfonate monooxygenase SsuD/methylene tetrahydromethanopterin reductase-like flavin-dependent oxidoreductase (luciferase family)|uniref:LLM class flavin-dependent oxidoreductase n=1 Tax=Mycolicibacter kumamotonensis TaxID=354243 RepID=A0A1B8SKL3_9MYCO|nr:LLM class flavin-dependent oxidoreductase [Mycolicibacter kumamotonensis]NDJ90616.1 LLM class flavin-dependent oxidoreductase [Mycolicibacter kumamotonensis]OBY33259.1 NADP oxidoreductase [Mycolicibacter kumamotonensis]
MTEWFLFLPQSRLGIDDVVLRARTAEASGFAGVAFIDHLETPMAPDAPIWEAMTIATWVAAHTERLRIGHLVLCDAFRHPAVLAKQAVTLAEASGGRFELGLGSGSMPDELARFGLGAPTAGQRVSALEQTVTAIKRYWAGGADTQLPTPSSPIPLLLAGRGPRMLELVARHADWWNLPAPNVDVLPELSAKIGSARVSVQQMVGFVPGGAGDAEGAAVISKAQRRFGQLGPGLVCGRADELVDYFAGLRGRGAQRFYVWFSDFAEPETIAEFGKQVISAFGQ